MVKSLLIGLLAVPLVLAFALAPVEAYPRRASLARLQAELGLNDAQVQAIRQVTVGQRESRAQLRHSLREARRALRELVFGAGDDVAVQTQAAEVQRLAAQEIQLRVDTMRAVSQILTPEQREKMRELRPTGHRGPRI